MIAKVEECCEHIFDARWFQWLLAGSVIYAAAWFYLLPPGGGLDVLFWLAVALWVSVFAVSLGELLLALGRSFKAHFLPWDGQERRWRERAEEGVKIAGAGR
jgi:hypothetical protein